MERLNTTRIEPAEPLPLETEPGTVLLCIGEAGCGKTELALNMSLSLRETGRRVRLFDMDATKSAFRSRDMEPLLRKRGVELHRSRALLDSPTVPDGLPEALDDCEAYTVLDVGGSYAGTLCLGQFRDKLRAGQVKTLYLFNPYRVFGRSAEEIRSIRSLIESVVGVSEVGLVCNPTLGEETGEGVWYEGMRLIERYFPGETPALALAPTGLEVECEHCPVFLIRRWMPTLLNGKEMN